MMLCLCVVCTIMRVNDENVCMCMHVNLSFAGQSPSYFPIILLPSHMLGSVFGIVANADNILQEFRNVSLLILSLYTTWEITSINLQQ